jgi:hypothetical protein
MIWGSGRNDKRTGRTCCIALGPGLPNKHAHILIYEINMNRFDEDVQQTKHGQCPQAMLWCGPIV